MDTRDVTRMMRRSVKNKRRRGGGGGSFSDRYSPKEGGEGKITPIVLFPADYAIPVKTEGGKRKKFKAPYGIVFRHYYKKANTFGRCSAGIIESDDGVLSEGDAPCIGCHEADKGKETGMAWAKKLHVFNGVEMADFHLVDSKRKNDKTGEFYKDPKKCKGKNCSYCDDDIPKRFGRRIYWPLGPSFSEQLTDEADFTISRACECGGEISIPAYECPKCRAVFRDLEEDPIDDENDEEYRKEMAELRYGIHECSECGYSGFMSPIHECDECSDPKPLTLWNVKMEVYTSGTGPTMSLRVRRFKKVSDAEWNKIEEITKNPIDLSRVFPEIGLRDQSRQYKLPIPDEFKGRGRDDGDDGDNDGDGPRSGSSAWD